MKQRAFQQLEGERLMAARKREGGGNRKMMQKTVLHRRSDHSSFSSRWQDAEPLHTDTPPDAIVDAWQEILEAEFHKGTPGIIGIPGEDGKVWYVTPHAAEDDPVDQVQGSSPITSIHIDLDDFEFSNGTRVVPDVAPALDGKMVKPPGSLIMQLTEYLPAKRRLRKDLEQVVADMRDEYFSALAAGDAREAKFALYRGRLELVRAIVPSWCATFVSWLVNWWLAKTP
jgi:hypothetical protein